MRDRDPAGVDRRQASTEASAQRKRNAREPLEAFGATHATPARDHQGASLNARMASASGQGLYLKGGGVMSDDFERLRSSTRTAWVALGPQRGECDLCLAA